METIVRYRLKLSRSRVRMSHVQMSHVQMVTCPDVTCPDVTCPDVTRPDVTCPDVTCPDVTCPDVTTTAPETVTSCPTPEQEVDYCAGSPCLNGGTCHNATGGYVCTCPEYFFGNQCQNGISIFVFFLYGLFWMAHPRMSLVIY